MLNIDIFTLGNPFKDDSGNDWNVTSNFSEKNKLFIEITKAEPVEPPEDLIPEE